MSYSIGLTFCEWMQLLNGYMAAYSGLTSDDFIDVDYFELWVAGLGPRSAAKEILREEGYGLL